MIPAQKLENKNQETFHECLCVFHGLRFVQLFVELDHETLTELLDLLSNFSFAFLEIVLLLVYFLGCGVKVQ